MHTSIEPKDYPKLQKMSRKELHEWGQKRIEQIYNDPEVIAEEPDHELLRWNRATRIYLEERTDGMTEKEKKKFDEKTEKDLTEWFEGYGKTLEELEIKLGRPATEEEEDMAITNFEEFFYSKN
jgi:hypothetical protein